jgi:hypothetical protein
VRVAHVVSIQQRIQLIQIIIIGWPPIRTLVKIEQPKFGNRIFDKQNPFTPFFGHYFITKSPSLRHGLIDQIVKLIRHRFVIAIQMEKRLSLFVRELRFLAVFARVANVTVSGSVAGWPTAGTKFRAKPSAVSAKTLASIEVYCCSASLPLQRTSQIHRNQPTLR